MGKFGAIRTVRAVGQEQPAARTEGTAGVAVSNSRSSSISMRGRPAGKRSNPDFEPTTIFLRKTTKKTANRTLQDSEEKQDLSELVESLLQQWISARA